MKIYTIQLPTLTESDKARFWAKVNKNGPLPDQSNQHYVGLNKCWLWMGYISSEGYGRFGCNHKSFSAHRVSSVLKHGEISTDLPCVLHRCDNRLCVNPDHLFRGTNKDNMNDRDKKCRGNSPKGSSHYTKTKPLLGSKNSMSKLDEMSVIEIRKLRKSGITLQNLSKMFNISQSVISSICSYKAWGHVP